MTRKHKHTNRLIRSSSPYLLQHARNPVDWFEWGTEAWEKAKKEDKPVLVSIGYASCHWCHVMEKESFENEDTAAIMNEYFVCIKVDREERPDIDRVYMDALQLISGHGGWPLNIFCLPDERPVHGGTYFPTADWNRLLLQISQLYSSKRKEMLEYAGKLTLGLREKGPVNVQEKEKITASVLEEIYHTWEKQLDRKEGGNARVPKFPLPNNFLYLLHYGLLANDSAAIDFTAFTLRKMAQGGIYDQIGGGFARYSVDGSWFVPHFEKMLYDNGQLLSLYSRMYTIRPEKLFRQRIEQTVSFLKQELLHGNGGFFSSLDADSEGMEGKYYVWQWEELSATLGEKGLNVLEYYRCTPEGNWENGWNILHCRFSEEEFALLKNINQEEFSRHLNEAKQLLMDKRGKRVKPALDDKIILCWNALTLEGLCDAYHALQDPEILELAIRNADFMLEKMTDGDRLFRIYKDGKASIPAFLEDYACLCSALMAFYRVSFLEKYLLAARKLADILIRDFYDSGDALFYFTSSFHEDLISRKKDVEDDVISSGNALMLENLRKLYFYFAEIRYRDICDKMATRMRAQFVRYPSWHSAWGQYYLHEAFGSIQLSATGAEFKRLLHEKSLDRFPDILLSGAAGSSSLPILESRFQKDSSLFFICKDETCLPPAKDFDRALEILSELKVAGDEKKQ
jgi:uncharacterized protein YyaL (SSP411 family)